MKTASVRDVQHNLNRVLRYLEHDEEVSITRRGRVVAKLVRAEPAAVPVEHPDYLARARTIFAHPAGPLLSRVINADREER